MEGGGEEGVCVCVFVCCVRVCMPVCVGGGSDYFKHSPLLF